MRGRSRFANLLLIGEIFRIGPNNIPPGTLIALVGLILIHFEIIAPFLSIRSSCLSLDKILYYEDYPRLITSVLVHANDWHLYYNCVSLIWKGLAIERRMTTPKFLILIAVFTPLTSIVYLLLNFVMLKFTDDYYYSSVCAVGASGVIFALKVIANEMSPDSTHYIMGSIPVKAKYAAWGELIVIYAFVPESSFTGHLAGILVGLAYCNLSIFKKLIAFLSSPFSNRRNAFVGGDHRFYSANENTRRETRRQNFEENYDPRQAYPEIHGELRMGRYTYARVFPR